MEDNSGPRVSQSFCQGVRDQYNMQMPVLYDPDGRFANAMNLANHHYHLVMSEENEIVYFDRGNDSAAVAEVQRLISQ